MTADLGLALAADGIGASDCEEIANGWLAQPINTFTSLAYVAVAIWVVLRVDRRLRPLASIYAVNLALIGIGSVVFHGPMPGWARVAHDVPIATTVLFMLLFDIAAITGKHRPLDMRVYAAGCVAILALFIAFPDASVGATAILVIATGIAEVLWLRSLGARWGRVTRLTKLYILLLVTLGGAAIFNALGKTVSPVCDPDSLFQGHGLWHILSAIAFGLWAMPAFDRRGRW